MDGNMSKGSTSLHKVLFSHLKTKEGGSIFAEIHQLGAEVPMVVVPNEAEVESILLCLNHQPLAFLLNYLPSAVGIPRSFVETLLKKSCDPLLFNKAFHCKQDASNWV